MDVLANHALHTQADWWIWTAGLVVLVLFGGGGLLYVWLAGRQFDREQARKHSDLRR